VIGHLKGDHRMRRNQLKGREDVLRWFREFLRVLLLIFG